jgi:hypothetical protein
MADDERNVDNIRDPSLLGPFIGCTLVDVTQDDLEDLADGCNRVYLHFSNGATVSFAIDADHGFDIETIEDEP